MHQFRTATRCAAGVWLAGIFLVAACGGRAGAPTTPSIGSATANPGATAAAGAPTAGASGVARLGFDCAALLSPSELDAAAGLQGGTVTTTRRGDQPADGEVMGVTECAIDIPSAGLWHGNIHVLVGPEALENFNAAFDFAKAQGATTLDGVGAEALLQSTDVGVTGYARGTNAVGVQVGVGWDEGTTTEAAVKDVVRQILITVLSRT